MTVCLEENIDISRGDMLTHPGNLPWVAPRGGSDLHLDARRTAALRHPLSHQAHHADRARAMHRGEFRIDPNTLHRQPAETLHLNEIGRLRLRLFKPLHLR